MQKIDGGSFTLDSDLPKSESMTINHSLGQIPNGIIVFTQDANPTNTSTELAIIYSTWIKYANDDATWSNASTYLHSQIGSNALPSYRNSNVGGISNATSTNFKIWSSSQIGRGFKANKQYNWIAWI